mmetsp:Transcript_39990/g.123568  ORF Transcript_39990/g.123568 Transcript_39990/m.123568 type:complete len:203 (-) Transcript_39990:70-678(-)
MRRRGAPRPCGASPDGAPGSESSEMLSVDVSMIGTPHTATSRKLNAAHSGCRWSSSSGNSRYQYHRPESIRPTTHAATSVGDPLSTHGYCATTREYAACAASDTTLRYHGMTESNTSTTACATARAPQAIRRHFFAPAVFVSARSATWASATLAAAVAAATSAMKATAATSRHAVNSTVCCAKKCAAGLWLADSLWNAACPS